jgi:hypothetical protein
MDKPMNTIIDFELCDGTVVPLTLTFYALYQLKSKHKDAYDTYNKIMVAGIKEEFDMIHILYTAYLCANLNNDNCLSFEEFLIGCGSKHNHVKKVVAVLVSPKN